ncbi:MAG: hypothetical protein ACP5DZ_10205 [Bacteroidales bacterium]
MEGHKVMSDALKTIRQMPDNGYIIAGYTNTTLKLFVTILSLKLILQQTDNAKV